MLELFHKGGMLMYPLLLCSFISLTITIERMIFWLREKRKSNATLIEKMLREVEKGNFAGALSMAKDDRDAIGRIIAYGLAHRDISMENSLELAAKDELDKMKRGLFLLDTIITISPLIGILGTVLGIIHSFDFLGVSGAEDPKAVTSGIAQALITTAAGLSVAIGTLIPYNYFSNRFQQATRKMEKYITSLEILYQKGVQHNETAD